VRATNPQAVIRLLGCPSLSPSERPTLTFAGGQARKEIASNMKQVTVHWY